MAGRKAAHSTGDGDSYVSLKSIDLTPSVPLIKFPRTPHMLDAGGSAVSRDDLVMSEKDYKVERSFVLIVRLQARFLSGQTLVIEEKVCLPCACPPLTPVQVDGANIGISIAQDWTFRVQNRSHFVNSGTHSQFKALDKFLSEHRSDLLAILGEPGQRILFGEYVARLSLVSNGCRWLFAKHSLHYERLPSFFLAFDIFECTTQTFLSLEERQRLLQDTCIEAVPLVAQVRRFCQPLSHSTGTI
jgi:atypical dual specificity phosphatase